MIVAKVYAEDAGSDSFFVSIDNNAEDIWDLNPGKDPTLFHVWREDEVALRGSGTFDNPQYDPYTFKLSKGIHTITFRGREIDTKLDYFYLQSKMPKPWGLKLN